MNNIGEIIKKEEEDKTYTIIDEVNKIFYIWSDILYDKKNHEPKNNFLDFKKWEEKEEFSIYEYQVQEIKEDEEFFSVILLGDTLFLKIMQKKIQKVTMNWTYTKI